MANCFLSQSAVSLAISILCCEHYYLLDGAAIAAAAAACNQK